MTKPPTTSLGNLSLSQMKLYFHMCNQWKYHLADMGFIPLADYPKFQVLIDLAATDGEVEKT